MRSYSFPRCLVGAEGFEPSLTTAVQDGNRTHTAPCTPEMPPGLHSGDVLMLCLFGFRALLRRIALSWVLPVSGFPFPKSHQLFAVVSQFFGCWVYRFK